MEAVAIEGSTNLKEGEDNFQVLQSNKNTCMKFVVGYQHQHAEISEMRKYAECVDVLYPKAIAGEEILFTKLAIVFCLICAIIGAISGAKDGDLFLSVVGFICAGVGGVLLVGIAVVIIECVRFLIT